MQTYVKWTNGNKITRIGELINFDENFCNIKHNNQIYQVKSDLIELASSDDIKAIIPLGKQTKEQIKLYYQAYLN